METTHIQHPSEMTLEDIGKELNERFDRKGFYGDNYYDNDMCLVDLLVIAYQVNSISIIRGNQESEAKLELLAIPDGVYANLEADRPW